MRGLILRNLSKLREYGGYLKELQAIPLDRLKGDFMARGAAERYLQVSIECVIDVGNEIISSLGLRRPERYRDIPAILAEAKVIPEVFAESVASMIGFRNLLVHDYALIDLDLVYEFIQRRVRDFEEFSRYIAECLEGSRRIE
ncbi:MAG: DUF86 domain-containing protein [Candidatus Bathyarchaeia archaeon]